MVIPRRVMRPISTHALLAEGDELPGEKHFALDFHFNPRPPCGGRRGVEYVPEDVAYFNPRPPCGGRQGEAVIDVCTGQFQPTPSLRRATNFGSVFSPPNHISTHALLAEGDLHCASGAREDEKNFNPRPPCGGRPANTLDGDAMPRFQPTPSLRRATLKQADASGKPSIFQPTPSLRRATTGNPVHHQKPYISTHALLAEGDGKLEQ